MCSPHSASATSDPSASQALAKAFGTLRRVFEATDAERAAVEGVGGVIAGAIGRWYEQPVNREFIDRLEAAGVNFGSEEEVQAALAARAAIPQTLAGKAVVVTGAVPGYTREEAEDAITVRGGSSPGSVSKKTFALVVGDGAGASKLNKAEQLGIPQIAAERRLRGAARRPASARSDQTTSDDDRSPRSSDSSDDVERPAVAARALAALGDLPVDDLGAVQTDVELLDQRVVARHERQGVVARLEDGGGRKVDLLARLGRRTVGRRRRCRSSASSTPSITSTPV